MLRFFITTFVLSHLLVSTVNPCVNTLQPYEEIKITYEVQYDFFVNYIKQHEGFRSKPYLCAGGFPTIGYGHRIKPCENLAYVSKAEAHAILLIDFEKAMRVVEKDNLPILVRIPIAHFIYCVGSGNYSRSKLRKCLLRKDYEKARYELLRWCYIKGKKSFYLLKMREIEASFVKNR